MASAAAVAALVLALSLSLVSLSLARRIDLSPHSGVITIPRSHHHLEGAGPSEERTTEGWTQRGRSGPETVQIAGSSLPDCSHACGSCSPCRLVMVSFVCASLEEAETCPMAYKCMCNSKSYPVP
ncbi:unnamed protein product [Spirodela intermedia]|uniref:Epidermal patterning factor-like protein n=1 Tax=Spirodela intermedia TaxID=51605 RepID=A0A7I8JFV2_SPIIN|nr:unnamed protein product [Spirodela intermedia]CAA6668811.1 unnamed protein product [Spirodela intermedia]